jgi:phosphotriesterase-related protein
MGPVAADSLGVTLVHEHLVLSIVCYWGPEESPGIAYGPVTLDRLADIRTHPFACRDNLVLDDVEATVSEIQRYARAGGQTIVEVTSANIGRDVRALRWLSEETGINIVAGCGYYIKPSYPAGFEVRSVEHLAEEMIADLTEGIGGTGIRAGVIGEIGMATCPMDQTERRVLQAAAHAQRAADVGIVTHTAPGVDSAFEIAEILDKAGADMSRVVISHLDERFGGDLKLYKRLAETGARLGFDTFGRQGYYASRGKQHPSDETRIRAISGLLDAGLGAHVLVSQDICVKTELAMFGGQGYAHFLDNIRPRLLKIGVSEDELAMILTRNPAQVLGSTQSSAVAGSQNQRQAQ